MELEKWGLQWKAGHLEDDTWNIWRLAASESEGDELVAKAWVSIQGDRVDVDLEIVSTPTLPTPAPGPNGEIRTNPAFSMKLVMALVDDLVLLGPLRPELAGKKIDLTFYDHAAGDVIKQFKQTSF